MTQPSVALDAQVIQAGPILLPSQRRLMILLMLALAALLQVATSGWGPIENGMDGMNAAIARELALGVQPAEIPQIWHQPVHVAPVHWITAQSFRIFNINEFAARLPFALANWLVVGLVFLIAERMGGTWRGLASGIICATMSGTILHGRDGAGAAITTLLLTIAVYALVRMLEQRSLARWQTLYWSAGAGLLVMDKPGASVVLLFAGWLSFGFFREARIRLRPLFWILGNLVFVGVLVALGGGQWFKAPDWEPDNALKYFWTLFPWSVVILPPFLLRLRKVLRLNELTAAEAVIWSLFVLGSAGVFLFPRHGEWPASIAGMAPLFALLASIVWERTNSRVRIVGVALLVLVAITSLGFFGRVAGREWSALLQPIWWLSAGVIILFGIAAIVALYLRHSRAALLIVAASTVPFAYNLLDARSRYDWQLTLKDFGKKVELGYMPGTEIYLGEDLDQVSSFLFYAPYGLRIYTLLDSQPGPNDYLLVSREKAADWPEAERIGTTGSHSLLRLRCQ